MKKFLMTLMAAAVLVPGMALAQMYYRDWDGNYYTSYSSTYQDRVRISNDRAQLAHDEDILARDRAFGNWWAISGDVWRVRQDRSQLNADITAYNADRGIAPRTYRYHYYYRY